MKYLWWLCQFVIGIFFAVNCLVIFTAYQAGQFSKLVEKNVSGCTLLGSPLTYALEDVAIVRNGTFRHAFGGSDDRSQWLHYLVKSRNYKESIAEMTTQGHIAMLNAPDYKTVSKAELIDFPFKDFHPHGLSAISMGADEYIFVVNHRRDGDSIEIFRIHYTDKNGDGANLNFVASVQSNRFRQLNNIVAVPLEFNSGKFGFYATNWLYYDIGTAEQLTEIYGKQPLGSVVYCELEGSIHQLSTVAKTNPTVKFDCKVVLDKVFTPNGIDISLDGYRIHIVYSLKSKVIVYKRNWETNGLDSVITEVATHIACDNVNLALDQSNATTDVMILGGLPRPLSKFVSQLAGIHMTNPTTAKRYIVDTQQRIIPSVMRAPVILQGSHTGNGHSSGIQLISNKVIVGSISTPTLVCDDILISN